MTECVLNAYANNKLMKNNLHLRGITITRIRNSAMVTLKIEHSCKRLPMQDVTVFEVEIPEANTHIHIYTQIENVVFLDRSL